MATEDFGNRCVLYFGSTLESDLRQFFKNYGISTDLFGKDEDDNDDENFADVQFVCNNNDAVSDEIEEILEEMESTLREKFELMLPSEIIHEIDRLQDDICGSKRQVELAEGVVGIMQRIYNDKV